MSIDHGPCGGVKVSCPSVIAEALPCVEHLTFTSTSQCGKIRETAQPFIVIRDYGGDLSLLEH